MFLEIDKVVDVKLIKDPEGSLALRNGLLDWSVEFDEDRYTVDFNSGGGDLIASTGNKMLRPNPTNRFMNGYIREYNNKSRIYKVCIKFGMHTHTSMSETIAEIPKIMVNTKSGTVIISKYDSNKDAYGTALIKWVASLLNRQYEFDNAAELVKKFEI